MSKVILVTVSDDRAGRKTGRYSQSQDELLATQSSQNIGFDRFAFWKWSDITATSFYRSNKRMLDHPDPDMNGRCYKPFVILEGLRSLDEGDFLIYNDVSPGIAYTAVDPNVFSLDVIKGLCESNGGILSACGEFDALIYNHTHENFTLERCMRKMGAEEYRHSLQHASTMIVLQKSARTVTFVEEWLYWNCDDECASLGSVREADFSGFTYRDTASGRNAYVVKHPDFNYWNEEVEAGYGKIGHRHDQSISGLLLNKMGQRLVKQSDDYCFLHFCRKNKEYEFIDSNQSPLPYKFRRQGALEEKTER